MATLRWSEDGEFMGWRWEKLGEAFGDGAARFAAESRIVSPRWAELDVLGAEVALRCSTTYRDTSPPKKQTGFLIVTK